MCTAQSISYKRTFSKGRTRGVAENWSTIVLPFTPSSAEVDGSDVSYYTSDTQSGRHLWLGYFKQEQDGDVTFSFEQGIKMNVPFIIAADKAVTGKLITWRASNVLLKAEPIAYTSGKQFLMAGSFVDQSLDGIYAVNGAGSLAKWSSSSQSVAPFRAYFKEIEPLDAHVDIPLPGTASASDVEDVTLAELVAHGVDGNDYCISNADVKGDDIYYNLMGQSVTNPAPGIYIHNGKKIVIK